MQKSEQINELAAALVAAQSEIRGAVKDASNPFFKSKYADLESVWEACREQLQKNGLAVSQVTEMAGTEMVLVTVLMHKSGQWLSGMYPVRPVKADPQSLGAAMTYARRYALAAIIGICQIEDDDGETASGRGQKPAQKFTPKPQAGAKTLPPSADMELTPEERAASEVDQKSPAPAKKAYQQVPGCISEKQRARLFAIATKANWPVEELKAYIEQVTGKKHSNEIPWVKYDEIWKFVENNPYPPAEQK